MKIHSQFPVALLSCLLAAFAAPAQAERADRDKPIELEAQRITVDDAKKIQTLEGDVVLTQGTLTIRSAKIVISEDKYGFQQGVATGGKDGLVHFRQKRDGRDDYVEGEAERIEYNTRNEVAELFRRAWIKSGTDEVKGNYIWYDAISEKYLVTAGDPKNSKAPPQRVRAVIQPKSKGEAPPEAPATKGAPQEQKGTGEQKTAPDKE